MKKAIVLYWSQGGNTEKVAGAIERGLVAGGFDTSIRKVVDAAAIDFFDFDLICFGVPSYGWHPPKQADEYLKAKFAQDS